MEKLLEKLLLIDPQPQPGRRCGNCRNAWPWGQHIHCDGPRWAENLTPQDFCEAWAPEFGVGLDDRGVPVEVWSVSTDTPAMWRLVRRRAPVMLEQWHGDAMGYLPRAVVSANTWDVIGLPLLAALNARRERLELRPLRRTFPLPLERGEGKEALLLLWGAERATDEQLPAVLANWRGLAPEERWWLVTQAEATRSHRDYSPTRGWRQEIYHILVENPVG